MKQLIVKQPRQWVGIILPHHKYDVVPMFPVYTEPIEHYKQQPVLEWGNEGNIGIE